MSSLLNRRRCAALAAAGISAFLGIPAAHGDFVLSIKSTTVKGADTDYVLAAQNNGLNGTGSTILALDCTLTSQGTGTTGAMVVDFRDLDGDGIPDPNLLGLTNPPGMPGPVQPDPYPNVVLPGGIFGSFIRIGGPNINPAQDQVFGVGNTLTSQGPLDPVFVNGTLHSFGVLELVSSSSTFKGPNASVTPVPIANVVVPTGTSWDFSGLISGEQGARQSVDFTESVPEPASAGLLALGALGMLNRRSRRENV